MNKALLFLLLISFQISGQDLNLYKKAEFKNTDGAVLPYRILFPENYDGSSDKSTKYPLVLFLHGAGERGNDNEKQLVHGSKLFLTDENRKKFPGIVLFPQCPTEGFWGSVKVDRSKNPIEFSFDYSQPVTPSLQAVVDLVKKLIKEERIDPSRVYVTGLSMGGMGTFEAVARNPELFAAAMPICGGGDYLNYNEKVKIPFWIFHGDADAVVNVKLSRDMVEKLKSMKVSVKYSEYGGVNHNSWDNAFAEPEYLSWLFAQRRSK